MKSERFDEMAILIQRLQELAKEEWGTEYLDCDCGHECKCDCFMCTDGWKLTEYLEIHSWEKQLLPFVTSREPLEYLRKLNG